MKFFLIAMLLPFLACGIPANTKWQDVPIEALVSNVVGSVESDPTVSSWAKQPDKPSYTPQEIGAQPTLVSGTNIKTVNGETLLGSGNIEIQGGGSESEARPLPPYLHELSFDSSYTNDAAWFYAQYGGLTGACSSRRNGTALERNYDWPFNDAAEFVVRMSGSEERAASVGVASVGTNLTEDVVTSGKWSRFYKCLPGMTLDGINSHGVVAEINVNSGTPTNWHGSTIHPLGAVRWVLDNATNAQHGARYIADNIFFPQGMTMNYHYMIADAEETWIVENGAAYKIDGVPAVMTNFRLFPAHDLDGEGLERYAILTNFNNSITSAWWTAAYERGTTPVRISDLRGLDPETVYHAWEGGTREEHRKEGKWWQTVHTSIYDISNCTLRLAVQEKDDWYVFGISGGGKIPPNAVEYVGGGLKTHDGTHAVGAADVGALALTGGEMNAGNGITFTENGWGSSDNKESIQIGGFSATGTSVAERNNTPGLKVWQTNKGDSISASVVRNGFLTRNNMTESGIIHPPPYATKYGNGEILVYDVDGQIHNTIFLPTVRGVSGTATFATVDDLYSGELATTGQVVRTTRQLSYEAASNVIAETKIAFANVTNVSGSAVVAADVGALPAAFGDARIYWEEPGGLYITAPVFGLDWVGGVYALDNAIKHNDEEVVYGLAVNGAEALHGDVQITIPTFTDAQQANFNALSTNTYSELTYNGLANRARGLHEDGAPPQYDISFNFTSLQWGRTVDGAFDALMYASDISTNNPTFCAAVGTVAANTVNAIVTQDFVRSKLGVYLYVGEDGGIYVHTNTNEE